MRLQTSGSLRIKWEANMHVKASATQGQKASLTTTHDMRLRAFGSSPKPALVSMTPKAIFLQRQYNTIILYNSIYKNKMAFCDKLCDLLFFLYIQSWGK